MLIFEAYLLLLGYAGARWLITVAGERRRGS